MSRDYSFLRSGLSSETYHKKSDNLSVYKHTRTHTGHISEVITGSPALTFLTSNYFRMPVERQVPRAHMTELPERERGTEYTSTAQFEHDRYTEDAIRDLTRDFFPQISLEIFYFATLVESGDICGSPPFPFIVYKWLIVHRAHRNR